MDYSASELMTIAAARALQDDDICFVGIGAPSATCNLARLTHARSISLTYESGTIGTKPDVLPLSIGDPELSATALTTVSVPEMFQYCLQGGRISVGFLGGAQIDRFGNINSTVIGNYESPSVRLPGAGAAPEIASLCRRVFVFVRQTRRSFVSPVDFITSFGHGAGGEARVHLGLRTAGTSLVVTSVHPGVTREQIAAATGWPTRFATEVVETPPPDVRVREALPDLQARTAQASGVLPEGSTP